MIAASKAERSDFLRNLEKDALETALELDALSGESLAKAILDAAQIASETAGCVAADKLIWKPNPPWRETAREARKHHLAVVVSFIWVGFSALGMLIELKEGKIHGWRGWYSMISIVIGGWACFHLLTVGEIIEEHGRQRVDSAKRNSDDVEQARERNVRAHAAASAEDKEITWQVRRILELCPELKAAG